MLQPSAPFSKQVDASAPWAVRRAETGRPFYFVVLEGRCRLRIEGPGGPTVLSLDTGDFVLIPSARGFTTASDDQDPPGPDDKVDTPITAIPGGARVGDPTRPITTRLRVGHCVFGSPDAALLVSLLPEWVHVRGEPRLSMLVQLVGDESRSDRPAREIVMARLLDVLLIEALRCGASASGSGGLVRGLSDPRLALALRRLHQEPARPWTMAQLAREAAMSRSAFFDRFSELVGMAPMAYLLAWRMALAKQWLRRPDATISDIAERVGYSSVSTFGVAFTRHVGLPPGRYARQAMDVVTSEEPETV